MCAIIQTTELNLNWLYRCTSMKVIFRYDQCWLGDLADKGRTANLILDFIHTLQLCEFYTTIRVYSLADVDQENRTSFPRTNLYIMLLLDLCLFSTKLNTYFMCKNFIIITIFDFARFNWNVIIVASTPISSSIRISNKTLISKSAHL